jgi:hypothetical protein
VSFGKEIFVVCTKLGVVEQSGLKVGGITTHLTQSGRCAQLPKTEEKNTEQQHKFNEKKCTR